MEHPVRLISHTTRIFNENAVAMIEGRGNSQKKKHVNMDRNLGTLVSPVLAACVAQLIKKMTQSKRKYTTKFKLKKENK